MMAKQKGQCLGLFICLCVVVVAHDLVVPVASEASFVDKKNYYTPDPPVSTPPSGLSPPVGTPPSGLSPPVGTPPSAPPVTPPYRTSPPHRHGGTPPYHVSPTPPTGNCGDPPPVPTPSTPRGGGGGSYYNPPPSTPGGGGGSYSNPPPSTPGGGGGSYSNPPPSTPDGGGGSYYNPPPSTPGGGGGSFSSPPPLDGTPSTPVIVSPPTTPIIIPGTPGTPTIPAPPFDPNSNPFTGTCNFWTTHPTVIWGLLGWWGTVGSAFGVPSMPGLPANLNLMQALSNNRNDGLGQLYREGTASFLNSMVNTRFPYTTQQVRESFTAALGSKSTAAAQARLFRLANEGHTKPRD